MAKLYLVGCGPGDRELITKKGENILKNSEIIFYFPPFDKIFADVIQNKESYFYFDFKFEDIKNIIEKALKEDKNVSFMVPGDFSIFSPFSSFINYFNEKTEIISGIGFFNYLAARVKKLLNPSSTVNQITILNTKVLKEKLKYFKLADFTNFTTTMIIYMNDIQLSELKTELLKVYNKNTAILIGYKLALENEEIFVGNLGNIEEIVNKRELNPKFTTIIIGEIGQLPSNIEWWDNKVDEIRRGKDS